MNLCSFASLVRVEVLHEYLPAPPEAFSYRVQPAPSEKVGFLSSCKETLFLVFSGNFTFWIFAALPRATATVRCPPPFVAFSSKTEMNIADSMQWNLHFTHTSHIIQMKFYSQFTSPHDSDQMSDRSQVSWIAPPGPDLQTSRRVWSCSEYNFSK